MTSIVKDDLTSREVIEMLLDVNHRNIEMLQGFAVVAEETKKAREMYERSIFYIFKEHSKISVIGVFAILTLTIVGAFCYLGSGNVEAKWKDGIFKRDIKTEIQGLEFPLPIKKQ